MFEAGRGGRRRKSKDGVLEGAKERLSPAAAAPTVGSLFMVPVRRRCGTHHLFYPRASRYRTHFIFGQLSSLHHPFPLSFLGKIDLKRVIDRNDRDNALNHRNRCHIII